MMNRTEILNVSQTIKKFTVQKQFIKKKKKPKTIKNLKKKIQ